MTSVIEEIPKSTVSQAHPVTRLMANMLSRRNNLDFQISCQTERLDASVLWKAQDQMERIDDLMERLLEAPTLDNSSILQHSAGYDRDRYLEIKRQFRDEFGEKVGEHMDAVFGDKRIRRTRKKERDPILDKLLSNLQNQRAAQRQQEWFTRATIAGQYFEQRGWFMLQETLTVRDEHLYKVFFGDDASKIWAQHIQKVGRAVRAAYYGGFSKVPKRGVPLKDYHQYIAVAEEGDLRGRPHIHILHFMRVLPQGCADPNAGRVVADEENIAQLSAFWRYGNSFVQPFRLHVRDAFGRLGWRWPVKIVGDRMVPQEFASVSRGAGYVAKYIVKSYNQRTLKWRIKATQQLGTQEIRQALSRLPVKHLRPLTQMPVRGLTLRQVKVPGNLVKVAAQKELLRRYLSKSRRAQRMILAFPALNCRLSLVRQFMNLMQRKSIHNWPSIGSTVTVRSCATAGFELQKYFDKMSQDYFESAFYAAGPTC